MSEEFHIDYQPICKEYAESTLTGTLYLAFRDIPQILCDHLQVPPEGKIKALDFGCGTGLSTRFLKSLNILGNSIEAEGVDISIGMLHHARKEDPEGRYFEMQRNRIPAEDETYDLVFNSFVLFEFATKEKMGQAIEEIKRVMKQGSLFVAAVGSAEMYDRKNQWVSLNVNFPQNDHLRSGELGRVDFLSEDATLTFQNYYWTEEDYLDVFRQAGLHWIKTHRPLGSMQEEKALEWKWKSETTVSPYYVFVLKRVF